MRWSRRASWRTACQRWAFAASFALGQLGALPGRATQEPYPYVRLVSDLPDGFAPSELIRRRHRATIILSHPLEVAHGDQCSSNPN